MLIKAGVDISRLNRAIRRALTIVHNLFDDPRHDFVITSTYDGNHGAGSLHYSNDAFDFRYSPDYDAFTYESLSQALGNDFDVVFEADHIHIEYDP